MARLRVLLRCARLSDQRAWKVQRSASEVVIEWAVGIGVTYYFLRQLWIATLGPAQMRWSAARTLIVLLGIAWLLLPATIPRSMAAQSLKSYPLTLLQLSAFSLLSMLQNWRCVVLCAASLAGIIAALRAPHSSEGINLPMEWMAVAVFLGLGSAAVRPELRFRTDRTKGNRRGAETRRFPLASKEFRYYKRMPGMYLALTFSLAAGLAEYFGSWMNAAAATFAFLFIALTQLAPVLNPFGLETSSELDRYRLLPMTYSRLLFQKHMCLSAIFVATTLPLIAAMVYRMPLAVFFMSLPMYFLVFMSWLVTGLLLMPLPAAQQIRLSYWTSSRRRVTVSLAVMAIILLAACPIACAILAATSSPVLGTAAALGLVSLLILGYVSLLHRRKWPVGTP